MTVIFVVEFASFIECTSQIHQNKVPIHLYLVHFCLLLFTINFLFLYLMKELLNLGKMVKRTWGKGE